MDQINPTILQGGFAGVLLMVLYFCGKIANTFVTAAMANQTKLVDGTLGAMKEITATIAKLNDSVDVNSDRLTKAELAVEHLRAENATAHDALVKGIQKLGGYRPSEDKMQAVRPRIGSRPDDR